MGQVILSMYRPDGTLIKEGSILTNPGGPVFCDGATWNGRDIFFIAHDSVFRRTLYHHRGTTSVKLREIPLTNNTVPRLGMVFNGRNFLMLRNPSGAGNHIVDRYGISDTTAYKLDTTTLDTTTKTGIAFDGQSYILLENPSGTASIEVWRDGLVQVQTLTGTSLLAEFVTFDGQDLILLRGEAAGTGYRLVRRRRVDGTGLGTFVLTTPTGFKDIADIDWDGKNILVFWLTVDGSDTHSEL